MKLRVQLCQPVFRAEEVELLRMVYSFTDLLRLMCKIPTLTNLAITEAQDIFQPQYQFDRDILPKIRMSKEIEPYKPIEKTHEIEQKRSDEQDYSSLDIYKIKDVEQMIFLPGLVEKIAQYKHHSKQHEELLVAIEQYNNKVYRKKDGSKSSREECAQYLRDQLCSLIKISKLPIQQKGFFKIDHSLAAVVVSGLKDIPNFELCCEWLDHSYTKILSDRAFK